MVIDQNVTTSDNGWLQSHHTCHVQAVTNKGFPAKQVVITLRKFLLLPLGNEIAPAEGGAHLSVRPQNASEHRSLTSDISEGVIYSSPRQRKISFLA